MISTLLLYTCFININHFFLPKCGHKKPFLSLLVTLDICRSILIEHTNSHLPRRLVIKRTDPPPPALFRATTTTRCLVWVMPVLLVVQLPAQVTSTYVSAVLLKQRLLLQLPAQPTPSLRLLGAVLKRTWTVSRR